MAKEIERKFLVKNMDWKTNSQGIYYHQGYLNDEPERTVRVRIAGNKAFLTIKGISKGFSRDEFEYEIPLTDASEILNKLCFKPNIEKYRYRINYNNHQWEIDEFAGDNKGLIVAEIELQTEDEKFELPDWIGQEVTGDPRYYNSNLIKNPYLSW